MNNIKIGLIGCGAASKRYYVPALKRHHGLCKNLFLVDKNLSAAQQLAHELNTQYFTNDYKNIINEIDGIIISVPHQFHYEYSKIFLENGIHVLCEKPLSETYKEAKNLVNLANTNNLTLMVNNTRRMFPSFRQIKNILASSELGEIKYINYFEAQEFGWESSDGFYVNPNLTNKGILLDIGSHVLDTICWWLGDKPDLVDYFDDSFGGPESLVHLVVEHNNCKINVKLNRLSDFDNYYEISCENGKIMGSVYDWDKIILIKNNTKPKNVFFNNTPATFPEFVYQIIDNFVSVLSNNVVPLIEGKDVLDSINLIEECYLNRQKFKLPWYENLEALNE